VESSDTGNPVVPDGAWAVIYDPATGYSILMPHEKDLPEPAAALVAAFLRLSTDDRSFIDDCLAWLKDQKQ
jgi:hypothetical protein